MTRYDFLDARLVIWLAIDLLLLFVNIEFWANNDQIWLPESRWMIFSNIWTNFNLIFGQFYVARKFIVNGGAIRPTYLLFVWSIWDNISETVHDVTNVCMKYTWPSVTSLHDLSNLMTFKDQIKATCETCETHIIRNTWTYMALHDIEPLETHTVYEVLYELSVYINTIDLGLSLNFISR